MPVGLMLQSMTYWEFTHWMALQGIDPGGEVRQDMRIALLTSEFVNTQIGKKQDRVKPERYMVGTKLFDAARQRYEHASGKVIKKFNKTRFFDNLQNVLKKD